MNVVRTSQLDDKFQTCLLNDKFETIEVPVNRKNISFALLKLKSNSFDEAKLISYLQNASVYYALPSKRIEELINKGQLRQLVDEAKDKFKSAKYNDGEGGELISYCINEDVLNAPKILSKLKLKTNNEDYVKGADGIHLLKIDEKNYEVIYAESKMYSDLNKAITSAFDSIDRFITGSSLEFEVTTLATNLKGEFEDIDVDYISNVILPSKENIRHNTAFSIFIGFEIPDTIDKSLGYEEYEQEIYLQVKSIIDENVSKINEKFEDAKRRAFSYYVYLIPFVNIENFRKEIIKKIKE